ncbi:MAG: hypothetical protein L3K07_04180 [Thermoplasmata archaeon]|nr:hypothetical protein [Thermoplasmata archaeon]
MRLRSGRAVELRWTRKLLSIVALTLLALPSLLLVPAVAAGAPGAAPTASAQPAPADFQTSANGNFSVWIPPPTVTPVAGAVVMGQFVVSLTSPLPASGTLSVWVPQAEATFFFSNGSVHLFRPAFELNFSSGSPTSSPLENLSTLVRVGLPFNQSSSAILSSQLAAVMSDQPYGAVHLAVTWHWILISPDGSTFSGAWGRPYSVLPALFVQMTNAGPTVLHPGDSFGMCLTGPLGGRTFSLHLEIANPLNDFVRVNRTVAPNTTGPLCWSARVATWVSPQVLIAHVWAYDRVTLLLYIVKVTIVNATSTLFGLPAFWATGPGIATLGALAVGLGVAVWGVWSRLPRSHRPPPPSGSS